VAPWDTQLGVVLGLGGAFPCECRHQGSRPAACLKIMAAGLSFLKSRGRRPSSLIFPHTALTCAITNYPQPPPAEMPRQA
jgi:hypothetical protein